VTVENFMEKPEKEDAVTEENFMEKPEKKEECCESKADAASDLLQPHAPEATELLVVQAQPEVEVPDRTSASSTDAPSPAAAASPVQTAAIAAGSRGLPRASQSSSLGVSTYGTALWNEQHRKQQQQRLDEFHQCKKTEQQHTWTNTEAKHSSESNNDGKARKQRNACCC